jgi:hypothetical protein
MACSRLVYDEHFFGERREHIYEERGKLRTPYTKNYCSLFGEVHAVSVRAQTPPNISSIQQGLRRSVGTIKSPRCFQPFALQVLAIPLQFYCLLHRGFHRPVRRRTGCYQIDETVTSATHPSRVVALPVCPSGVINAASRVGCNLEHCNSVRGEVGSIQWGPSCETACGWECREP